MNLSTMTVNFVVGSNEHKARQALEDWICKYGNACGIDTANPERPRFFMASDCIKTYQQAINDFGELWISFNDAGLDEITFMSAYNAALQKTEGQYQDQESLFS